MTNRLPKSIFAILLGLAALGAYPVGAADEGQAGLPGARQVLESRGHKLFLSLVDAAGMGSMLERKGVTLMVPSEEVLASFDEASMAELRADREALRGLLAQHLVPKAMNLSTLLGLGTIQSETGLNLLFASSEEQGASCNGMALVATDVVADGVVIHVLDGLLMAADIEEIEMDEGDVDLDD